MSNKSWTRFLESLHFDERLAPWLQIKAKNDSISVTCIRAWRLSQEFNEGDVGVAGGIQVLEPASQHPTSVESIRRYGGSTAPTMPWPEEPGHSAFSSRGSLLRCLQPLIRCAGMRRLRPGG